MNPAVYDEVMRRDRVCVLSFLEEGHQCRDVWGTPHAPDQSPTYEHVKRDLALGIKKVDDPRWGVRLCGYANNRPPTKVQRAMFRLYLSKVSA
jgi:hypothetical protein